MWVASFRLMPLVLTKQPVEIAAVFAIRSGMENQLTARYSHPQKQLPSSPIRPARNKTLHDHLPSIRPPCQSLPLKLYNKPLIRVCIRMVLDRNLPHNGTDTVPQFLMLSYWTCIGSRSSLGVHTGESGAGIPLSRKDGRHMRAQRLGIQLRRSVPDVLSELENGNIPLFERTFRVISARRATLCRTLSFWHRSSDLPVALSPSLRLPRLVGTHTPLLLKQRHGGPDTGHAARSSSSRRH
jgi:hypothetical protein